ncbi:hypothetical protein OH786_34095 [Streptomyces atratus]|nr:hypothetical protein [Streptomyces atratus]
MMDAREDKYDRSAIDVQPHPPYVEPLKCWECGVDVHVRHGNADDLDSKSSHCVKNPGKDHGPRCPYDLERRGKELVDPSQNGGPQGRARRGQGTMFPNKTYRGSNRQTRCLVAAGR